MDSGLIDMRILSAPSRTTGVSMMRILTAAASALCIAYSACLPTSASAQTMPELTNEMIDFTYNPPKNEKFKTIYESMRQRRILERLAEFLSPINLRGGLMLSLEDSCAEDNPNSYYDGRGTLHLCYSFFYMLENGASRDVMGVDAPPEAKYNICGLHFESANAGFAKLSTPGLMPGITRPEVIVGGTVQVILHELGHALFDIQEIPLLGREEDAADQIAAMVMLQFGKDVALATIKGTYNVWHHLNECDLLATRGKVTPRWEVDEHSISIQRAYNYLCMAYGSKERAAFEQLADRLLPPIRKSNCESEYRQAALAFRKTVLPDLDEPKMNRVMQMDVLRSEDFRFD